MSERDIYQEEIRVQEADRKREKKILDSILYYYGKKLEIEQFLGENISIPDFKKYLRDHNYPQLLDAQIDVITTKVENRQTALDELRRKAEKRQEEFTQATETFLSDALGSLDQLVVIPSWRKLLGTNFTGFYLNENVLEIIKDTVVLLPALALSGFENTIGEPFFLMIGPGVYYTAFRLSPSEIITDYREITGVLLPLEMYEKAQDVSASVISTTQNFLMTEYLTSIPFSIIEAKQTTQMFLRGVIARNVIHPNREAYDLLVKICEDIESFNLDEGFKILSGGLSTKIPLYTNEILTEKPIQRNKYSTLTAGIKNIQPKVEKIIEDLKIGNMKVDLFAKMNLIKKDFIKIGHPRLTDWMV
ncbi:MAG: hypothetical protein ACXAB4_10980 [Candidatus Hodarchaeales archaeon]|jgi:hypothetical protein